MIDLCDADLRVMHSTYVDSITLQSPEVARALLSYAGLSFDTFLTNHAIGVLRHRASVDDGGQPAVALEVYDGTDYSTLAVVRAELLRADVTEVATAWSSGMDDALRKITED